MEWRDEGIILGTRKHGETSAILEVMTRCARAASRASSGAGARASSSPCCRPATGRCPMAGAARRASRHLPGRGARLNAARLFDSAAAIYGLQTLAGHLRLLPERDPHERLYETLGLVIEHLDDPLAAGELVVRFELMLLDELGFGLDLSECAATGARERSRLCVAEIWPGGFARRRRTVARQDAVAAGLPVAGSGLRAGPRRYRRRFPADGLLLCPPCLRAAGLVEPEARAAFLGALRRHHAKPSVGSGESAA